MATQKGTSTIIHLKIAGKRTTASIDTNLADLVCVKLANKLSKNAGKELTNWAQAHCEAAGYLFTEGISSSIRLAALLFIVDPEIREKWAQVDDE